MLKKDITFENYEGNTVTETFYFNLNEAEIVELEVEYEGGLEGAIRRIIAANNHKALVAEFKKLILLSYGVKSEDGKRFIKSDELRDQFTQTAAYPKLFLELATDDDKASEFMLGILPRDMSRSVATELAKKPTLPPPSGTMSTPSV